MHDGLFVRVTDLRTPPSSLLTENLRPHGGQKLQQRGQVGPWVIDCWNAL